MSGFPYQFPEIAGLTEETQLYTQRRSDGESPADARFTINDLYEFLTDNYMIVISYGEFDSDEDAGANGVPINSYYEMSVSNIYGLPQGVLKKRIQ